MEKSFKQLEEWAIKWKASHKVDEFFVARLRLTFYYTLTAVVILGISSLALYNTILSNLSQSIRENELNPFIYRVIMDRAQDILLRRFLTIDIVLVFFIVILGFFITQKTLKPIKSNMEKQKRFIADASHELRTPTAVIISGLEVALRNKKLDFVSAKKTLENTLDEMHELSLLSNNLLDISKYDTPITFERESVDIHELINNIVEKNKNLAKIKDIDIELKLTKEAKIKGNRMELSRVFYNVLDNAIKYTKTFGKITISDKTSTNRYIVSIEDTGTGIPKDILDKIFDPFFRGDIARNTNGAGLGLTMAKKIIENHKGTISIKSLENKGTTVIISLPTSS